MVELKEAQERVVLAGRRLVEAGLVARTWGNVSCRVDSARFVITPSGRDYRTLTASDIVEVLVEDGSYRGDIRPSSEKGLHAAVYRRFPDAGFVIHTHQTNASVVSALGLSAVRTEHAPAILGGEVPVASYALPGTRKLRASVIRALERGRGKAAIMAHHGALCFGADSEEAFAAAEALEEACGEFIIGKYRTESGAARLEGAKADPSAIAEFAANRASGRRRSVRGFPGGDDAPTDDALVSAIRAKHPRAAHIIRSTRTYTAAAALAGLTIKPCVDDFAQIIGLTARTAQPNPRSVLAALGRSSAVLVGDGSALCCGATEEDASAVAIVLEKGCRIYLESMLFGKPKVIDPVESLLMRFVYAHRYSKQMSMR